MEDKRVIDNRANSVPIDEQQFEPYEQMCISLYAYRYGAIGFLELIAKFEESLGLPTPLYRGSIRAKQNR